MKKFKAICVTLIICLSFLTVASAVSDDVITVPYSYPVVLGTDEWVALGSFQARIDACKVPEELLTNMTTDALIETTLNYPFAGNIGLFDDLQMGLESIKEYCEPLQELYLRDDAFEKLLQLTLTEQFLQDSSVIRRDFLNAIIADMSGSYEIKIEDSPAITMGITHTDYTPAGSKIYLRYDSTWSDHSMSASDGQAYHDWVKNAYPEAIEITRENPAYNCHSYTFYSASTSNKYWLDGGYARYYITDGSYTSVSPGRAGDKIWYSAAHSGIVYSVSGGQVTVTSKWGCAGLFRHAVMQCPWASENGVTYYR